MCERACSLGSAVPFLVLTLGFFVPVSLVVRWWSGPSMGSLLLWWNTVTKASQRRKGFISTSLSVPEGSQDKNWSRAEPGGRRCWCRVHRGVLLTALLFMFFSLISFRTQDHHLRDCTTHNGLYPPPSMSSCNTNISLLSHANSFLVNPQHHTLACTSQYKTFYKHKKSHNLYKFKHFKIPPL